MDSKERATILIVDDNRIDRAVIECSLTDQYELLMAQDGAEALKIMRTGGVSVALLDLSMPVMDGFCVLEAMRQEQALADIPVIVITASEDPKELDKALQLGAIDLISKPIIPEMLRTRVRNAVFIWTSRHIEEEREWLSSRVEQQARELTQFQFDTMTGLYDFHLFCEKAKEMIAQKPVGYYIISYLDVDNFKVVNDQYGMEVGDRVLKQIAALIKLFSDGCDGIASRVHADNFVVLFPDTKDSILPVITKALSKTIAKEGVHLTMKMSVGRYLVDDRTLSISAMMDRALLARRSVKGRYDTHVAYFNETMREKILREQWIISEMERALTDGQFEVWFQPQYNHASGEISGAEALVRWRHPQKGLVSPGEFVPVFERNGFIYELDKYVWRKSCILLRKWMDTGKQIQPISVNVSRHDFFQPNFFEVISGLVARYQIPKHLFRLEITESAFVNASEQIVTIVQRLRENDFWVEIDDFGSGYSSLNTLKDVPANVLKIDMRFFDSTNNFERSGNILESIVRMASWLNMSVIAEGVEEKEHADFLRSVGCVYIQGFLYAKPMPAEEYEKLLFSSKQESKPTMLEQLPQMNTDSFWNPASIETMVFNRYAGGACVFECTRSRIELLRVNDKFKEVFQSTRNEEEILKINPLLFTDEEGRANAIEAIKNAVEKQSAEVFEATIPSAHDPEHREHIRFTIRLIARSGERYLFYAYVENVSAQRRAERIAQVTMEQLRFLNDISSDLLVDMDSDEAIRAILDKMLDYFQGKRAYVFEKSADQKEYNCTYEICESKESSRMDRLKKVAIESCACLMHAFQTQTHSVVASTDEDPDKRELLKVLGMNSFVAVPLQREGKLIGFMGVEDATRKMAHVDRMEALGHYMAVVLIRRDLNLRLKQDADAMNSLMNDVLDHLPCGVGLYEMVDGAPNMTYVNKEYNRLVGRPLLEMYQGRGTMAVVHPEDRAPLVREIQTALQENRDIQMDLRIKHEEGFYRHFHLVGRIINKEESKATICATFTPIEEMKDGSGTEASK